MTTTKKLPNKVGFSLLSISKNRDKLYGVMTILIIFCHTFVRYDIIFSKSAVLMRLFEHLRHMSVVGVDMFLIMSAISLYFSFSSNPRIKDFYKKRAIRILPPVIIVSGIWFALINSEGLSSFLCDFFLLSFFTKGDRTFWFFALLIILYALYPLLHKLYEKSGNISIILSILAIYIMNFLLKTYMADLYYNIEVALIRLPSFLFGCWLGKYVKEGMNISSIWLMLSFVVFVLINGLVFFNIANTSTAFYYLCFPCAAVSILLLSFVLSKFSFRRLSPVLVFVGSYSLEFYLIYEKVRELSRPFIGRNDSSLCILYSFTFLVTLVVSVGLKTLCKRITKA